MKKRIIIPLIVITIWACSVPAPSVQKKVDATLTVGPATETGIPPADFACLETFEAHELKKPYTGDGPRYTLSAEEWNDYLSLMGIQSPCLPVELGAPFINADWDSVKMPATGRMVSIGFENLYQGAGWSDLFLIYSTYDFTTGTEFDRFASVEDRDALRGHTMPHEILINGISGFIRFKPSMWGYEGQPQIIYKTYVFPFTDYYVSLVYKLGAFDGEPDLLIRNFQQGDYPSSSIPYVEMMDFLVKSLHFTNRP